MILFAWATGIIIVAVVIIFASPKGFLVNSAFLFVVILLYSTIFHFPNVRIKRELLRTTIDWVAECRQIDISKRDRDDNNSKQTTLPLGDKNQESILMELIKAEHSKAVEEIKQRSMIDDQWWNNKFILIGGLFAAFIAYSSRFTRKISDGAERNNEVKVKISNVWSDFITDIGHMFKTILPSSVLGMACIVSLAIDLHIRSNGMITRQLGLWIQNYVECVIVERGYYVGYLGWETFLRINNSTNNTQGLHMDYLFNIIDAIHYYFTSIYLYIIYIGCLLFYFSRNECEKGEFNVFLFIFFLVHFTLAIFSIGGNYFPSTLEVQLALWKDHWFSGGMVVLTPFAISLLVLGLAWMRLYTLHRNRDPDSRRNDAALGAPVHSPKEPERGDFYQI
jgi:hypothetical protein